MGHVTRIRSHTNNFNSLFANRLTNPNRITWVREFDLKLVGNRWACVCQICIFCYNFLRNSIDFSAMKEKRLRSYRERSNIEGSV